MAVREDTKQTFVLQGANPGLLSSWQEIITPAPALTMLQTWTARFHLKKLCLFTIRLHNFGGQLGSNGSRMAASLLS
jgi:hypothetical protein